MRALPAHYFSAHHAFGVLHWDTALNDVRGTYGYYQVRSNGVDPKQGFITEGNIHMNVIGLFLQDAWSVNNKLTVNVGIREQLLVNVGAGPTSCDEQPHAKTDNKASMRISPLRMTPCYWSRLSSSCAK